MCFFSVIQAFQGGQDGSSRLRTNAWLERGPDT